jgi:hypothetical protein
MNNPIIQQKEKEIIDSCPIDIYVASCMPYEYRFKLLKPKNATPSLASSGEKLIMDSGIGDDISNKDVLDSALKYDCEYIVAKDYLHQKEKTTKSIRDFWYQYDKHGYSGDVLIPLQEPHIEHYYELGEPDAVLIGGIKNYSVRRQIETIQKFSKSVSDDVYIHALGMGMSEEFIKFIKRNPNIVDSVDCSTPEQNPINNRISDATMKQSQFITPKGKTSSFFRHKIAHLMIVQLNYLMSDLCSMDMYSVEEQSRSIFDY